MKTTTLITAMMLMSISSTASANHFDGNTPLLCSIYQLYECDHPNGCIAVSPAQVNAMSHFDVDFRSKTVTRSDSTTGQSSTIRSIDTIDRKLIIQGVEDGEEDERDGAGWSVSILDPEGTMTMAIAGDGFGIMGLGACVPQP